MLLLDQMWAAEQPGASPSRQEPTKPELHEDPKGAEPREIAPPLRSSLRDTSPSLEDYASLVQLCRCAGLEKAAVQLESEAGGCEGLISLKGPVLAPPHESY